MNYDGDGESYFSPNSERPGKEGRRNVRSDFTSERGKVVFGYQEG
jgi:hypothetical protein